MPTSSATKHRPIWREPKAWIWVVGAGLGLLLVVSTGVAAYAYGSVGQNIVRGVTAAGQDVGGRSTLEAIHLLERKWEDFRSKSFTVEGGGRTMSLLISTDTSSEEEVVLALAEFDPTLAANRALTFGRRGSWWQQVRERTSGFLGRHHELATVTTATDDIEQTIREHYADLEQPAQDAKLTIDAQGRASVVPSVNGRTFDFATTAATIARRARNLDIGTVTLTAVTAQPNVATSATLSTIAGRDVVQFLGRAPLTLTWSDRSWTLTRAQLGSLLGFAGTTAAPRLGFDRAATTTYLEKLAKEIDVAPQNAKFTIEGGKAQEFQPGKVGTTLDIAASLATMQQALIDQGHAAAALTVIEEPPLSASSSATELGIKELVAEATTSFKGSPTNRRYNLSYGAKLLNGLLIQPGEEFSLVKALGKIDGAHGWKPELVIKGSAITPEFGGGLCQVATTMFRTALNAGLPIVERRNHSLRISYYEPPIGLDATIYEPKPDLRFRNDYGYPLLIQTKVDGTNLTFQFYGTKDGRSVDIPTPKVYNRVGIPATKNIEVDDLKPGEKECQAPGHPGADATATYTVTKADGTKVTQVFQSHYRAIGIICRVGKKATPKPTTNTNTSTNTNTAPVNTNTAPPDTNTAPETNTNAGA